MKFPPFTDNSQSGEILSILTAGGTLTHREAMQLGIMCFTARITEIRAAGYNVICHMETSKNKHGKPIKYGRYSLIKGGSHE
ncbi:helix-turn-helix domain-containing protein [Kingella oralis]|jgi:hypothetical protein|uniref:Winged helix-turn-helix domain-containing protein n=1 Tax=Kingella oralis ATCC 51147 TaxID=629741 RepID=C4GIX3_9NEIS|nr:helix-turn-helix domain-containing protein [Kingella oralis]EEP67745.1 hypothetical protein GCWU000324_01995 [Kingella oralis ATCC 51147]QMT43409.1 hypothetical protein H3L93_03470 [Kingella oralis]